MVSNATSKEQNSSLPRALTDSLQQDFVRIPSGSFTMGNSLSSEELVRRWGGNKKLYDLAPPHQVALSRDYYLCRFPVRVKDYAQFVRETGYKTAAETEGSARVFCSDGGWRDVPGASWRAPGFAQTGYHPVVCVTWRDALKYIEWLNVNYRDKIPTGFRYALPTEAEWEYACRAGTTTEFFWGTNEARDGQGYLNGADEAGAPNGRKWDSFFPFNGGYAATSPVCSFKPNAWGLYDALGNVWEWCADGLDAYPTSPRVDPVGKGSGSTRAIRGGSWCYGPGYCRSASRAMSEISARISRLGFRLALKRTQDDRPATSTVVVPNPSRPAEPPTITPSAKPTEKTTESSTPKPTARPSGKAPGEAFRWTIKGVESVFRYCPAGTFVMGSPTSEAGRSADETQRDVALTKGFWILETPVTQALWKAVVGDNPSFFKGDDLPVERVSWNQCADFVALLNKRDLAPDGFIFDLPTEAEWEYAARAGSASPYYFGAAISSGDANFGENVGKTTPVKTYRPNAWGLYDFLGNVGEWCSDRYGAYPDRAESDPVGATNGVKRVFRGGGWCYGAPYCRAAQRKFDAPSFSANRIGVRIVLRERVDKRLAEAEAQSSNSSKSREDSVSIIKKPSTSGASVRSGKFAAGTPLFITIGSSKYLFRYCPPSSFWMGSPTDEARRRPDETRHNVTLTSGFWILETPVTQALWEEISENNPSDFKGDKLPVERVSWFDCVSFVSKLNSSNWKPDNLFFDLPTEAEWEYACRAGTSSPYSFGAEIDRQRANFGANINKTTNVKSYPANAWGLYDMHGNVWEWCLDWYGNYPANEATDPIGVLNGRSRVVRGGSWGIVGGYCRSASRHCLEPSYKENRIGFRLILRFCDEKQKEAPQKREKIEQNTIADSSIKSDASSPSNLPTKESNSATPRQTNFFDDAKDAERSIKAGAVRKIRIGSSESVFRYCPPDSFRMGSPNSEAGRQPDETQHNVTLTTGFWISEAPVTQELWKEISGDNPSDFKGNQLPVECVSWFDCLSFISKLNRGAWKPDDLFFDLPTEAEWEYACRAGTSTPYSYSSEIAPQNATLRQYANFGANIGKTTEVKSYPPNAWGLYDMHGNVYEWCSDWYGNYSKKPITDPIGASGKSYRVVRGGSWYDRGEVCRSASRHYLAPSERDSDLGFRLVLRDRFLSQFVEGRPKKTPTRKKKTPPKPSALPEHSEPPTQPAPPEPTQPATKTPPLPSPTPPLAPPARQESNSAALTCKTEKDSLSLPKSTSDSAYVVPSHRIVLNYGREPIKDNQDNKSLKTIFGCCFWLLLIIISFYFGYEHILKFTISCFIFIFRLIMICMTLMVLYAMGKVRLKK